MANIEELNRAIKWIEENPELHKQHVWGMQTPCGTALRLFGAVAVLNGWTLCDDFGKPPVVGGESVACVRKDGRTRDTVFNVATDILGLDPMDAEILSNAQNTVEDLKEMRNALADGNDLDCWQ